LNRIAQH